MLVGKGSGNEDFFLLRAVKLQKESVPRWNTAITEPILNCKMKITVQFSNLFG